MTTLGAWWTIPSDRPSFTVLIDSQGSLTMINPTVLKDNHDAWIKFVNSHDGDYFILCENAYGGWYVAAGKLINHYQNITYWYAHFADNQPIFCFGPSGSGNLSRSEFLFNIELKYPQYFEWMLWNLP